MISRSKAITKLLLVFIFFSSHTFAQQSDLLRPLPNTNNNPFTLIHDISKHLNQSAVVFDGFSTAFTLSTANLSSNSSTDSEVILLDGEITTVNLQLGYRITPKMHASISSSLVQHSGGKLDSLIEDWHSLWGLPNGNRNEFQQNQLSYSYENKQQKLVDFNQAERKISDTIISLAWALNDNRTWQVQTAIKLPTGSVADFSGSGHFAAALSVAHNQTHQIFDQTLWAQSQLGVQVTEGSDVLPEQINTSVVFANFNIAWQAMNQLALKMQLHGNSAYFDSSLTELGKSRLQLVFGGTYQLSKHALLDLSLSEDLTINASPDVTFSIGIQLLN